MALRTVAAEDESMSDDKQRVRFNWQTTPEVLDALDELRKLEPSPMPHRTEMLNRVVLRALDAKRKRAKPE